MSDRFDRYVPLAQLFAARLVLFQEVVARQLGLTATELKCVRLVQGGVADTASGLVAETGLTPASISVVVDRLVERGFVLREQDGADRRRRLLRVVPAGIEKIDALYDDHAEAARAALAGYDEEEFELILAFMSTFSDMLRRSAIEIAGVGAKARNDAA